MNSCSKQPQSAEFIWKAQAGDASTKRTLDHKVLSFRGGGEGGSQRGQQRAFYGGSLLNDGGVKRRRRHWQTGFLFWQVLFSSSSFHSFCLSPGFCVCVHFTPRSVLLFCAQPEQVGALSLSLFVFGALGATFRRLAPGSTEREQTLLLKMMTLGW